MTTKILNDELIDQIQDVFGQLQQPVEVLFFGKKSECEHCDETLQLVSEVVGISDKLSLSVYDVDETPEVARQYNVDKTPGLVIAAREGDQILDYGIRFAGIPSGHEFSSLIHDLILVSGRDSGLSPQTREFLQKLEKPVHLMVFVTPTCPYCPRAVVMAHQMALESHMVEAEMVEATEFPDLADRFDVSGVPQTTINLGAGMTLGAVPEQDLVEAIRSAMKA